MPHPLTALFVRAQALIHSLLPGTKQRSTNKQRANGWAVHAFSAVAEFVLASIPAWTLLMSLLNIQGVKRDSKEEEEESNMKAINLLRQQCCVKTKTVKIYCQAS